MKTRFFVSLALTTSLTLTQIRAQTPVISPPAPTSPLPAVSTDPAKVADFEKRFAQGKNLEDAGKLVEARAIFDGIIVESPEAKGSLLEAGRISVRLNEMEKADVYFDKLHALVPDYPLAIESLIQINQALKRDVKVDRLIREFTDLHASGKVPQFTQSLLFVRERIHLDSGDEIVFSQFFDYTQPPNTVWMAEQLDPSGARTRWLLLNFDPQTSPGTAQNQAPSNTRQYLLVENVIKDGKPVRIDAYFQMFTLPDYKKVRNTMLGIVGGAYKPVYSQALEPSP